jgi:hypothetical protein
MQASLVVDRVSSSEAWGWLDISMSFKNTGEFMVGVDIG